MSIFTFGDSHIMGAFVSFPTIKRNHLGAILCYSFGKKKLDCLNIKTYGVLENDTVIFSFGEIDCRCHVYKHITQTRTYENIIDDLVKNYFDAIYENVKDYNKLNVYVYNVVPVPQLFNTNNDNGFPFRGSDEERKSFVLYFNKKINEYCKTYNYNFLSVYDYYIDENGYLNKKYSDDHVHIAHDKNEYLEKVLRDNKIIF